MLLCLCRFFRELEMDFGAGALRCDCEVSLRGGVMHRDLSAP